MDEIKLQKRKRKAKNEGNNRLLVLSCTDLADFYMKSGQFQQAIDEFKTLADVHKSEKNQIEYAKANRGIGEAYLGLNNVKKALEHQKIYLNIAIQEKNDVEVQRAYATIGNIYLTSYLDTQTNPEENLNAAYKYFMKSMKVCEGLSGISKLEKADMQARLFSNLGIVKESLGDYNKALELFTTSITICKNNDIYEQLSRGHMSIASLYDKKGDSVKTMHHYNLSIEALKKLKENVHLMCPTLFTKSEALIKLGDFHAAKKSLYKAYKLKSPNIQERKTIELYLKAVVTMCHTEDKLVVETNDNRELKNLYEKMGDCACTVKNYPKALEYYKLMLNYAEKCGINSKELAVCYNSLAQTYEDNKMHKEAIEYFEKEYNLRDNIKDILDALCKIADNKEMADEPVDEIVKVYNKGINYCKQKRNLKEERRMITRCMLYLHRVHNEAEAYKFEQQLNALKVPDNESDSSVCNSEDPIFDENDSINLDDITDSEDSDIESKASHPATVASGKRRSKNFIIKKNAKGESQLHVACINGKIPVVKHLLEQGHPVNIRDNTGWLPIHEACNHGYYEIVKLLLDKGAAINDRGGVKCEGITPIFDAANNGHLKTVELLLDRGASVTIKADNGDTPLNVLKLWHQRYPFTGQSLNLYQSIIRRMTEALKKVGQNVNEEVVIHESIDDSEEYNCAAEDLSEKSDDENESDRDSESSSGDHFSKNSAPDLLNEYQEIMKNLGKKSLKHKEIKSGVGKKSALVREHDLSFDDWLDDDMQPAKATKKRKTSLTEAVVTSSTLRRNSSNNSLSRHNSPTKRISDENRPTNNDISGTSPTAASPFKKKITINNTQSNVKRKFQSLLDTGISKISHPNKNKPTTSTFQRHRSLENHGKQPKITAFGSSKSFAEADSTSKFPATQVPITQEASRNMVNISAVTTGDLMVFVDVKIEGKVFRVPVLLSQIQTNTIGWLADQAAQKYARKECSKPCLELETTSGALLSDEDPLSLLFPLGSTQAEPIVGRITKFYITPLVVRYKEACSHMKEDINKSLTTVLEEVSVKLNLKNRGFLATTLSPLCKALNHQTTLLDLNLSGNFLDISCMTILCGSLPTLVNLTSLSLRCTGLTSNHLTEMVKMFSSASNKILEKLKQLDLSNNYLRNKSLSNIAEILKYVKLEGLNLENVAFNDGLFKEVDNIDVTVDLGDVRDLNISNNQLNRSDVKRILSWTTISKLVELNISRNTFNRMQLGDRHEDIENYSSLESLNLSRCKLQDNDLYELFRLCSGSSLTKIDVSYNSNITGISLRRLLEHPTLQDINLIGCDNIFEYFPESCEGIDQNPKTTIKLSSNFHKYAIQVDSLIQHFKRLHLQCSIEKENNLLLMHSTPVEM